MPNRCDLCLHLIVNDLPSCQKLARGLHLRPIDYAPYQQVVNAIHWHYTECPQCSDWKRWIMATGTTPPPLPEENSHV